MTGHRKGAEAGLTRAAWLDPRAVSRQETLKAERYDLIHHFISSLVTGRRTGWRGPGNTGAP